ncbi:MAG: Streptomycin adenylyltransferase [Mucilaginibacter sp.]|nr:Streptomycin adenylyltransferase [Mucilaginibacter sp.]
MIALFKNKLPDSVKQLSPFRAERLNELLSLLQNNNQIFGILLGGSLSYKEDFVKSDVDLFCLVDQVSVFETNLNTLLALLPDVDAVVFQGSFPWTEKLYTVYFNNDIDFSIDLCLISSENAETFFWEPNGYILLDNGEMINKSRTKQIACPGFTRQPFLKPNPFSLAVVTLKKIEKNISRGHLWNAIEQLNIFRRYVMQIIRLNVIKHEDFLGRVDRDIEDVLPSEINLKLSKTVPIYHSADIASKTIVLIEVFICLLDYLQESNEKLLQDWISKQLDNERIKLTHHIHNA